jgi:hypothetical protein
MMNRPSPIASMLIAQIGLVSIGAYLSQLLIFDETDWYWIDRYDALVWATIVTQVFALAIYASRCRVTTIRQSLSVFYCLAGLAAGLTLAATLFLVIEAILHNQATLSLLAIAPGYWIAVFVFLVSMFLHLRLTLICLIPVTRTVPIFRTVDFPAVDSAEATSNQNTRFSMIDIFAFTGLAAVSISSYRLVVAIMNGYDALRFLALFYAASVTAFFVYAMTAFPRVKSHLRLAALGVFIVSIAIAEFWIGQQLRTRFHRIGISGTTMPIVVAQIVFWNAFVAAATWVQLQIVDLRVPRASN